MQHFVLKSQFDDEAEPSLPEIMAALDAHELWLKTDGLEGKQLTGTDLPVQCKDVSFDGRNLSRSDLTVVEFISCSMRNVKWTGADLGCSRFINCEINGSTFDNADLMGCWFRNCEGIETASFKNVKVLDAEIPGVTPFGHSLHEKIICIRNSAKADLQ